jgi:flagellin
MTAMRINTNVAALQASRNAFLSNRDQDASMNKLSSGLRITRAADDAAGLAIANTLRSNTRGLVQAASNATQANAYLSIAEGALTQIQRILERQNELFVQNSSTATIGTQTSAITNEFTTLSAEIQRILDSTEYQGQDIFGAQRSFRVGDSSGSSEVNISVDLNVTGISTASVSSVSAALASVNSALARIGAGQSRLDYTIANLRTAIVNQRAAESVIRDADMAEEMANFTRSQILTQAGTAMLSQANQSAQNVLSIIRG